MKNKAYILWSGGCDSTALLHIMAHNHEAVAISNKNSLLNPVQVKAEAKARRKMKKVFKKQGLNIKYIETNFTVKYDQNALAFGNHKLGQPGLWVAGLISLIEANSTIEFAYIRGDCMAAYSSALKSSIEKLAEIACHEKPEVRFPLLDYKKKTIVHYLKKNDLLKLTHFCQEPIAETGKACGKCSKCIEVDLAEIEIEKYGIEKQEEIWPEEPDTEEDMKKDSETKAKP